MNTLTGYRRIPSLHCSLDSNSLRSRAVIASGLLIVPFPILLVLSLVLVVVNDSVDAALNTVSILMIVLCVVLLSVGIGYDPSQTQGSKMAASCRSLQVFLLLLLL